MPVKAALAAAAALAVLLGLALPRPGGDEAKAQSQIPTIELDG